MSKLPCKYTVVIKPIIKYLRWYTFVMLFIISFPYDHILYFFYSYVKTLLQFFYSFKRKFYVRISQILSRVF